MPRLAGKTALITGAARGIGYGIAAAFLAEGAEYVLITDITPAPPSRSARAKLEPASGGQGLCPLGIGPRTDGGLDAEPIKAGGLKTICWRYIN